MNELIIDTPRLTLRSMAEADLEQLLTIFADPKVMAAFNTAPFNRDQMSRWLRRNLAHQIEHGFGLFSVILKTESILIGDCGLEIMQIDETPVAELGYDFRSDYWNRGFATEAAAAVRDFAFGTLQLPRLISLIRVGNAASRRVSEKIGLHLEREINRGGIPYWLCTLDRHQPRPPIEAA